MKTQVFQLTDTESLSDLKVERPDLVEGIADFRKKSAWETILKRALDPQSVDEALLDIALDWYDKHPHTFGEIEKLLQDEIPSECLDEEIIAIPAEILLYDPEEEEYQAYRQALKELKDFNEQQETNAIDFYAEGFPATPYEVEESEERAVIVKEGDEEVPLEELLNGYRLHDDAPQRPNFAQRFRQEVAYNCRVFESLWGMAKQAIATTIPPRILLLQNAL